MVWLMAALGLVILLFAGDALVKGAVNLALRIGIPALIVSLTIVAFGTSAPELLISIQAAMTGVPGIAMGNVVGSNTANILLVLGVPALIAVMHTAEHDTRKSFVVMIAASLLFIALAFRGVFDWISALILLGALALALADMFLDARKHKAAAGLIAEGIDDSDDLDDLEGADPDMPWWKIILFLVLGLAGLPLGADILVDSATVIARTFGISETVIGLTLVAVGTSMPELATTVMAAIRRQADVALGNVIGSNLFNLLAIIGIAAFVAPIPVDQQFLTYDLWVMLAASLLLIPFVFLRQNIGRIWGLILIVFYVSYVSLMFI